MKRIIIFFFLSIFFNIWFGKIVFDFTWKVVKVDDWDTIWVETKKADYKIRILWIDTPEIMAPYTKIKKYKFYWCWDEAKKFAEKILLNNVVRIYYDDLSKKKDKYGRFLRYAFVKIRYKWRYIWLPYGALAIYKWRARVYKYENFTLKRVYYKLENIAKSRHIWIWSSKCKLEDKAIKQRYLNNRSFYPSNNNIFSDNSITNNIIKKKNLTCGYTYHKPGCDIKWNISRRWEKIYHLPWRKYYSRTIITPSKGERWFCTEQEAIRCWRRPSRIK